MLSSFFLLVSSLITLSQKSYRQHSTVSMMKYLNILSTITRIKYCQHLCYHVCSHSTARLIFFKKSQNTWNDNLSLQLDDELIKEIQIIIAENYVSIYAPIILFIDENFTNNL